jgi:dipeptidyl aminopeptidase/acylaminoacyl peptidase
MMSLKLRLWMVALCALVVVSTTLAAEPDRLDLQRAKQLNQRARQGEKLSAEDQAYLDRARAERGKTSLPTPVPAATATGTRPTASKPGLRGDDANQRSKVAGIPISTDVAPLDKFVAKTEDGQEIRAYLRKPPGDGPFPAIICLHGGVEAVSDGTLQELLRRNPTYTRLLARGYVVVAGDFRTYEKNPQARGPVLDCLAIVDAVKKLPYVDPDSVVIFGGSGGGSLALDTAASTSLAAILCGEPASIIFTGMLGEGEFGQRMAILREVHRRYTPELKAYTQAKIKKISCPVMILDGNVHMLKVINQEILLPELKAAAIDVDYKIYDGNGHGFYWGSSTNEKTLEQFLADIDAFLATRLKTKPTPIANAGVTKK